VQNTNNITRHFGLRSSWKLAIDEHQIPSVFISLGQETFLPQDRLRPSSQFLQSSRVGVSFGIEDDITLLKDRLNITPTLQFDQYWSRFYGENPYLFSPIAPRRSWSEGFIATRLGMRFDLTKWLSLKGNVGRYTRPPNFYELFGDKGAIIGNTDLKPERGINSDIGLRARYDRVWWATDVAGEITYYNNNLTDLIQFIQNSQRVSRPHNIGRAHIRGVEISGGAVLLRWLRVGSNYTYQAAVDASRVPHQRGRTLPNRPRHELDGRIDLFLPRGQVFYEHTFQDQNYLDRANLRPVPAKTIRNVGVTVTPSDHLKITFEIKNLTNNQIADLWGYPLPGRAYFTSITGRW
jgi:iron complex outermembrane receptor protein